MTGEWLSNSDARQLIAPGCPAQFRYDKDHGVKQENDAFAMGHAVHARILGKGETIAVRPAEFDSWRTNASKAWRAGQEALGRSVILPEQAEIVEAMARAMCIADSPNWPPDSMFQPAPHLPERPRWHEWRDDALRQYRAWLAMQSILLGDYRASAQRPIEERSDDASPVTPEPA